MALPRRTFLKLGATSVAAPAFSRIATAETYPTRPISIIVPYPAGGSTDAIARIVAERMTGSLRQPIIIENVGGADGSIGTGRVARARPDGYTIELIPSSIMLNGAFDSLPYDVLNDFAPVAPLVKNPSVLFARNTMPAKDLHELIAWLKSNPNKASAGIVAAAYRLYAAYFQKETGTQFTLVPYRGGPAAAQDLVAGHLDLALLTPDQLALIRAGKIKAYAVIGDTRMALAPDIPTVGEMGLPALSSPGWFALFTPKGTPKDIIAKLNAAAVEALADPAVRSRLADLGGENLPREQQTPEALSALQKAYADKWWPLIKELGIKAE